MTMMTAMKKSRIDRRGDIIRAEEQGYAGDHEQPLRLRRPFADVFTFQQRRALRVPERQHTAHVKQREDGGKRDGALPERGNTH